MIRKLAFTILVVVWVPSSFPPVPVLLKRWRYTTRQAYEKTGSMLTSFSKRRYRDQEDTTSTRCPVSQGPGGEDLDFADPFSEINNLFYNRGCPMACPLCPDQGVGKRDAERHGLPADKVVGIVDLMKGQATVEKIAANA